MLLSVLVYQMVFVTPSHVGRSHSASRGAVKRPSSRQQVALGPAQCLWPGHLVTLWGSLENHLGAGTLLRRPKLLQLPELLFPQTSVPHLPP